MLVQCFFVVVAFSLSYYFLLLLLLFALHIFLTFFVLLKCFELKNVLYLAITTKSGYFITQCVCMFCVCVCFVIRVSLFCFVFLLRLYLASFYNSFVIQTFALHSKWDLAFIFSVCSVFFNISFFLFYSLINTIYVCFGSSPNKLSDHLKIRLGQPILLLIPSIQYSQSGKMGFRKGFV